MSILTILITMAIVGFVLWLIVTYIPMPEPIRKVIVAVTILLVLLWLLEGLGALGTLSRPIRIGP